MKKRKEQPEKEPVTREDAAHAVNLAYACARQVLLRWISLQPEVSDF